jgi:cytochrome c biogenesis protein CcmG, thiol:disulfide interchange protein DsbE
LIGLLVYGVSAHSASRTLDERVARGERPAAPQARRSLPLLAGAGKESLESYAGKVVVLERAQAQLERHAGTVLGVAYLDASPDSQSFVRRYRLTYPNLRDSDGEFARAYGTDQLPESFIVDRHGRVAAISRGEIDQAFLGKATRLAETGS